jgi:A/G-specific adenine glycosylase
MSTKIEDFQRVVWDYYRAHGRRDLPWRVPEADGSFDAYKILVSEVMLQQTQVARVIPKYHLFLKQFPSIAALAAAPLADVLRAWNGLGYNRRAKFLWQCASRVASEFGGKLPDSSAGLAQLPGIGANTAGAVMAYAFNKPVLFVETNIRTVFIHHFFPGKSDVTDRQILNLVAQTLPDEPRQWYWALMDYGSHLKQTVGNLNSLSKHYTKQSRFEGSKRQIRGQVLRLLGERPHEVSELQEQIADNRLADVLRDLAAEGFIAKTARSYRLK